MEPAALPLLQGHPMLTSVVRRRPRAASARARVSAHAATCGRSRCDTALELQGLLEVGFLGAAVRCAPHRRIGPAPARREPSSALLLTERVPPAQDVVHVIDSNLALLRALGIEAVGTREFVLPESPAARQAIDAAVATNGWRDFAIVNPGGGWPSKLWPASAWGELARGLRARGLTPVVTWGPGEERLADAVVEASFGTAVRFVPTTLLEYVELARRARLVAAADTGPLHLACAVGTPVVGVFGPTDPARNGPFDAADEVVRVVPPCAPCHRRTCVVHADVMSSIPVADVLAAADRRLARAGERRAAL